MCIYRDVRKSETFHIPIKKNCVSHILFVEKEANQIPCSAEKGAFRYAHPHYAIYRKLLPAPAPPLSENSDQPVIRTTESLQCSRWVSNDQKRIQVDRNHAVTSVRWMHMQFCRKCCAMAHIVTPIYNLYFNYQAPVSCIDTAIMHIMMHNM